MRPLLEQQAAALARARGITLDEARQLLAKTATTTVAVRPPKGH